MISTQNKYIQSKYIQSWIHSPVVDLVFIISPAFLITLIVILFRNSFDHTEALPLWAWIVFIVLVDVAHVYSSVFRTYFNPLEFKQNATLFTLIPFFAWLISVILYSLNDLLFWRVLAYIAVFHFVRQQYGFMALYSRKQPDEYKPFKLLDAALIYIATIYPIIFWHTHLPRNFNWFVEDDFLVGLPVLVERICLILYLLISVCYIVKEVYLSIKTKYFNIPKNLILLGTGLSWYVGIVLLNGDMAFTAINVVSHGIPYMALLWIYGRGISQQSDPLISEQAILQFRFPKLNLSYKFLFSIICIPVFLVFLWSFAYLEESLWDSLVWRENPTLFQAFYSLPLLKSKQFLAIIVPLLSLPQLTHYILDAFIWRLKPLNDKANNNWVNTLFYTSNTQ